MNPMQEKKCHLITRRGGGGYKMNKEKVFSTKNVFCGLRWHKLMLSNTFNCFNKRHRRTFLAREGKRERVRDVFICKCCYWCLDSFQSISEKSKKAVKSKRWKRKKRGDRWNEAKRVRKEGGPKVLGRKRVQKVFPFTVWHFARWS